LTGIYNAVAHNVTLQVLGAAASIFFCGYQAQRNGNLGAARAWWVWSALILFVYAITLVFSGEWVSLIIVCVFLVADAGWITWFSEGMPADGQRR
jgi:hypothetical protein